MGINLSQTQRVWGVDSKEWLGSRMGMDVCRSITVDLSLFNALHYSNGFIPSGTVLGKVTATGLYGPYSPALANGLDVAAGFLFDSITMTRDGLPITTGVVGAALFWTGIVRTGKLPNFTGAADTLGELDTNGRADMASWIRYESN